MTDVKPGGLGRRDVLVGATAAPAAMALPATGTASSSVSSKGAPMPTMTVEFRLNGQPRAVETDVRAVLLDTLRDAMGSTGTKKGCDHGQCGACTVHIDGRRVLSCLTLTATVQGREVATIEGLAGADGALHPMQAAFVAHDAFQCGYCTPGQIMSAVACVREGHAGSDAEIREYMSGNLCRCAAYPNIVAAVKDARAKMRA